MRIERCPRTIGVPAWAAAILVAWGAGVGAIYLWDRGRGRVPALCLFRRLTGEPCPTCGGTRAVAALARADWTDAVVQNPLVVAGVLLLGLWLLARLVVGRNVALTPDERRVALGVALAALAANWVYLIVRSR